MSVCRTVGRCVCQYNPTDDTVYTSPTPTAESLRVTLLTSCCAIRKHSFQFRASHHPDMCVCAKERERQCERHAEGRRWKRPLITKWMKRFSGQSLWGETPHRGLCGNKLDEAMSVWPNVCPRTTLAGLTADWLTPTTSCLHRVTSRLSLHCLTDVCQMLFKSVASMSNSSFHYCSANFHSFRFHSYLLDWNKGLYVVTNTIWA